MLDEWHTVPPTSQSIMCEDVVQVFSSELCTLYILLCSTQPILVVLLDSAVLASGTHTLVH